MVVLGNFLTIRGGVSKDKNTSGRVAGCCFSKEFLKREKCLYLSNICYLDHCYLENNWADRMIPFWFDCAEVRMINEKPKPICQILFPLAALCLVTHSPSPSLDKSDLEGKVTEDLHFILS